MRRRSRCRCMHLEIAWLEVRAGASGCPFWKINDYCCLPTADVKYSLHTKEAFDRPTASHLLAVAVWDSPDGYLDHTPAS